MGEGARNSIQTSRCFGHIQTHAFLLLLFLVFGQLVLVFSRQGIKVVLLTLVYTMGNGFQLLGSLLKGEQAV